MLKRLFLFLCLCLLLVGCAGTKDLDTYSSQLFAMDTVMDLSVYAEDDQILTEASQLVTDLERKFSTTEQGSEVYVLNRNGSARLSEDTAELMEQALGFCRETGGALDLSIYPVVRAWGFTTDAYRVPAQEELNALLANVDYNKIEFSAEDRTVSLPAGMEIDLGSVAKGYTGDRLLSLFRENGVTSALLNLGGNVQALGSKPDGSLWRVGIQDPQGEDYIAVISVADQAVITSGGYERFFEDEYGNLYWHIIDPATGCPAKNGLISATAVGSKGVYCDALSTSLFIMGPEKAVEFWRQQQDFDMILITENRELLITPGLEPNFQLLDGVPYTLQVIPDA